jgi:hypothetical protein
MNVLSEYLHFITNDSDHETLNKSFQTRYSHLPDDYLAFLKTYSLLTNKSDTTWFNSIRDFNETNDENAFKWNEFEIQSLEAFDGDVENQKVVKNFWNQHVPIILSVKNGYSYFAIHVSEENFGKIYYGQEPEFEETELVSNSFSSFIEAIQKKSLKKEYLDLF